MFLVLVLLPLHVRVGLYIAQPRFNQRVNAFENDSCVKETGLIHNIELTILPHPSHAPQHVLHMELQNTKVPVSFS